MNRPLDDRQRNRSMAGPFQNPKPSAPSAGPPRSHGPFKSLDVLVVEDNPVNQKVVVGLLIKWGHHAVVAGDGACGLETLERQNFDLVLMDIQMPVMDGIEATRSIRARELERGGHIPIIAITAHAATLDRVRCLDAGVDRYLTKPMDSELLRRAIGELIPSTTAEPTPAATAEPTPSTPAEPTPAATFEPTPSTPAEPTPAATAEPTPSTPAEPTPSATVEPNSAPAGDLVDFDQLKEFVGDDPALLAEVVQIFLEDAPATLENAARAIAQADPQALETAAHRLKGSLSTMGAPTVAETANALEALGREGVSTGAADLFDQLTREVGVTLESLRLWKDRLAA